jgi:anti-anti-sigma factor
MSFRFCSHAWEIQHTRGGAVVSISARDLGPDTLPVLADELFDLVQEAGQNDLALDLGNLRQITDDAMGKFAELNTRLRQHGGRLILNRVQPTVYESLRTARLTDSLDVQCPSSAETIS